MEFSEDEIKGELARLGYGDVSEDRLAEFQKDLHRLIEHERSKSTSANTSLSSALGQGAEASHPGQEFSQGAGMDRHPALGTLPFQVRDLEADREVGNYNFSSESGLPLRGDYSTYESNTETSGTRPIRDDVSDTGSERRMIKRKILRRNNSGTKFIDESVTESELGSVADPSERLHRLCDFDERPRSSEPPYRLSPDDPRPASVILRPTEHPHTRSISRNDPVSRYHQYRQSWDAHRAPGEKQHKGLRWNIREQMLAQDVMEKKPQRVYVPNDYVVPTDKHRRSLRWQVRMDIAMGNKPPCGFFQQY